MLGSHLSLTRYELEEFATHAVGMTTAQLRRMSTPFLAQLFQLKSHNPYDTYRLMNTVHGLENRKRRQAKDMTAREGRHRAITARMRRIAGRWIVFQEHNGDYYYLVMAAQQEAKQSIRQRVHEVYDMDFPFLCAAQHRPCSS